MQHERESELGVVFPLAERSDGVYSVSLSGPEVLVLLGLRALHDGPKGYELHVSGVHVVSKAFDVGLDAMLAFVQEGALLVGVGGLMLLEAPVACTPLRLGPGLRWPEPLALQVEVRHQRAMHRLSPNLDLVVRLDFAEAATPPARPRSG